MCLLVTLTMSTTVIDSNFMSSSQNGRRHFWGKNRSLSSTDNKKHSTNAFVTTARLFQHFGHKHCGKNKVRIVRLITQSVQ